MYSDATCEKKSFSAIYKYSASSNLSSCSGATERSIPSDDLTREFRIIVVLACSSREWNCTSSVLAARIRLRLYFLVQLLRSDGVRAVEAVEIDRFLVLDYR
jgi:hypothetical protein